MKHYLKFASAISIGVGFCLLLLFPAYAQETTPDAVDLVKLQAYKDSLPLDFIPPSSVVEMLSSREAQQGEEADATQRGNVANWTLLTGQALFDSGWEIVTVRSDTQDVKRLTNDGAVDIRPALNREATRIVFTSNRSGNNDLFAMNSDGTGLHQLTAASGSNDFASWFPHSDQIIFASDRQGTWEIYTMNGDGSNQVSISYDPEADNVFPAISPDGSKVAWVKRQGRSGQIWIKFFADASAFPLGESCDYMQNVKWVSEDELLFDCDVDGNVMNEVVSISMTNPNFWYSPYVRGPLEETWVGGVLLIWEPGGYYRRLLTTTEIRYVIQNQNLYIGNFWSEIDDSSGGAKHIVPLTLLRSWQKTDWTPPITALIDVPPVHYGPAFEGDPITRTPAFTFQSFDTGSGIERCLLEYRTNGGAWKYASTVDSLECDLNHAYLWARLGEHIELRTIGRDHAGNVEDVSQKAPVSTYFYRGRLIGQVTDRMGLPLSGVTYESAQLVVPTDATDASGAFEGYILKDDSVNVRLAHPAFPAQTRTVQTADFTPYPEKPFLYHADTHFSATLYTADNLLKDGGFEQKILVDWQSVPVTATQLVDVDPAVGVQSLQLGYSNPSIGALRCDSLSSYQIEQSDLAYSENGVLHVLWGYQYQQCSAGICSPQENIYRTQSPPHTEGRVLRTGVGRIGVAIQENVNGQGRLRFFERRNGTWFSTEIASAANGFSAWKPDMQIGADGTIHLIWAELVPHPSTGIYRSTLRYRERRGSTWSSIQTLFTAPEDGSWITSARLRLDANQSPHIFFALDKLYEVERSTQGAWLPPRAMEKQGAFAVDMIFGADNLLHMVWWGEGLLYASRNDGAWGSEELVTEDPGFFYEGAPHVAVLSDGSPLILWRNAKFYIRNSVGGWNSSDIRLANTDRESLTSTLLQVGPTSQAALLTQAQDDLCLYEIQLLSTNAHAGRASIHRHFEVPQQLANPTLFFAADFSSEGSVDNNNRLLVEVDDGTTISRTLEIAEPTNGWRPYAASLYPWKGKEITITISVDVVEEDAFAWAKLDAMQIASWDTPWIQAVVVEPLAVQRASIPVGVSASVVITGENFIDGATVTFGGVPAKKVRVISLQRIEAETPTNLPAGFFDLTVTNPGGISAVQRHTLSVGQHLYLPTLRR